MTAPPSTHRSAGLLLCGGRSQRMGYDKASLRFAGGQPLLLRVLDSLRLVCEPIVLSTARGQVLPALPEDLAGEVSTVPDVEDYPGPLWALREGFRALQGQAEQVLVLAVDLPFFGQDWMQGLLDGLVDHEACISRFEGFDNPLLGAYGLHLLPQLEALVAAQERRPIRLSQQARTRVLELEPLLAGSDPSPGAPAPWMDVDTPDAYREALLADGLGSPGGADVTVYLPLGDPRCPLDAGAQPFVPLQVRTPREALSAVRELFPELDALELDASAGLALQARGVPEAPLLAGDERIPPGDHELRIL